GAPARLRLARGARARERPAARLQPRDRLLRRRGRPRRAARDRQDRAGVIGVLVSGEGTNLQALIDARLPIACVASNKAHVGALERAQAAGIPTAVFPLDDYRDRTARDEAMRAWLATRGVRLVVLAGYMHLLTPAFLERFPGRVVNVHPSLLPDFPGSRPLEDAIAAGVETTGVTAGGSSRCAR